MSKAPLDVLKQYNRENKQRGEGGGVKDAMTRIDITEKQFQEQIKELAAIYHWKYYHTWTSIHSPRGFVDVAMVRESRLIFAELKSDKGKLTPYQSEWLDALKKTGAEVYVWRPGDFNDIVLILG